MENDLIKKYKLIVNVTVVTLITLFLLSIVFIVISLMNFTGEIMEMVIPMLSTTLVLALVVVAIKVFESYRPKVLAKAYTPITSEDRTKAKLLYTKTNTIAKIPYKELNKRGKNDFQYDLKRLLISIGNGVHIKEKFVKKYVIFIGEINKLDKNTIKQYPKYYNYLEEIVELFERNKSRI